jgi:hypothetical protein
MPQHKPNKLVVLFQIVTPEEGTYFRPQESGCKETLMDFIFPSSIVVDVVEDRSVGCRSSQSSVLKFKGIWINILKINNVKLISYLLMESLASTTSPIPLQDNWYLVE